MADRLFNLAAQILGFVNDDGKDSHDESTPVTVSVEKTKSSSPVFSMSREFDADFPRKICTIEFTADSVKSLIFGGIIGSLTSPPVEPPPDDGGGAAEDSVNNVPFAVFGNENVSEQYVYQLPLAVGV